jgi:hypothetical protein
MRWSTHKHKHIIRAHLWEALMNDPTIAVVMFGVICLGYFALLGFIFWLAIKFAIAIMNPPSKEGKDEAINP